MARYPAAVWMPSPNVGGPIGAVRLGVIHLMAGSLTGTDNWFATPAAQVSAHFGVGRDGAVHQYVDTSRTAWAEAAFNDVAISIEHEGVAGDALTAEQIAADINLIRWIHDEHNIPIVRAASPSDGGWLGHCDLGVAGGDHPDCPGSPILAQLPSLLAQAAAATQPSSPPPAASPIGGNMVLRDPATGGYWVTNPAGAVDCYNSEGVPDGPGAAPFLGAFTNHPEFDAGAGAANGACIGIVVAPDNGYYLVAAGSAAIPAFYHFDRAGSLAR